MVYTGQQPHTCATTFVAYRVSCSPSRLNTEVYLSSADWRVNALCKATCQQHAALHTR